MSFQHSWRAWVVEYIQYGDTNTQISLSGKAFHGGGPWKPGQGRHFTKAVCLCYSFFPRPTQTLFPTYFIMYLSILFPVTLPVSVGLTGTHVRLKRIWADLKGPSLVTHWELWLYTFRAGLPFQLPSVVLTHSCCGPEPSVSHYHYQRSSDC